MGTSRKTVEPTTSPPKGGQAQGLTSNMPTAEPPKGGPATSGDADGSKKGLRFHNKAMNELLFVEIFAETARLSKVARDNGFNILPVDKTAERASQVFIANYDLTEPDEFAALMKLLELEQSRILAVHIAPACGTASRAREKKLIKFRNKGLKVPQPLRSKDKPLGVDGLQGLDKVRTESANMVYTATATLMAFCITNRILCSLENPWNSLFWDYPDVKTIFDWHAGYDFNTACMEEHGTRRPVGGHQKMCLVNSLPNAMGRTNMLHGIQHRLDNT